MAQIPTGLVSHARKVCTLYKRALRSLECRYIERDEYRYHAVLLRERFDKNRNIPDARVAKQLLLDGEEEYFQNQYYHLIQFPESPGGIAYERFHDPPDAVIDYWEPIEKARYPKYFAQREKLKVEYEELYKKLFPETTKEADKAK